VGEDAAANPFSSSTFAISWRWWLGKVWTLSTWMERRMPAGNDNIRTKNKKNVQKYKNIFLFYAYH